MSKNAMLMALSGRPSLPKSNRRGSKGSPRMRLRPMQPTETMYEKISAAFDTETIALRATSEPKLIAARMAETAKQT